MEDVSQKVTDIVATVERIEQAEALFTCELVLVPSRITSQWVLQTPHLPTTLLNYPLRNTKYLTSFPNQTYGGKRGRPTVLKAVSLMFFFFQ